MSTLVIRISPWRQTPGTEQDRDWLTCSITLTCTGRDNAGDQTAEMIDRPLGPFYALLDRKVDERDRRIEYGKELYGLLFGSPDAIRVFTLALERASEEAPLRVQLDISRYLPRLHELWWETLHQPSDDFPLSFYETLYFSRYIGSVDPRRVQLREAGSIDALVVVASPRNSVQKRLPPIDVKAELTRARRSLDGMPHEPLVSSPTQAVTMDALCSALRRRTGGFDILYLVCHGFFTQDEHESRLWLENDEGNAEAISGVGLAARLGELASPPRLIMLVACESAGNGLAGPLKDEDTGALTSLGPQLARGGIPAVVAMRGKITVQTMDAFLPEFFAALSDNDAPGQIDRAVAQARAKVRDRHDAWMPLLFMRLNQGRLWVTPESNEDDFSNEEHWDALLNYLRSGLGTPILGAGMLEHLIGPQRDVAIGLANRYQYPLAQHHREDLPQVAQYLSLTQAANDARFAVIRQMRLALLRKWGHVLGDDALNQEFFELLNEAGRLRRQAEPNEPFAVLARLRCPLYVTTTYDSLLTAALREQLKQEPQPENREPIVHACNWQGPDTPAPQVQLSERPVIYHLFGRFRLQMGRPDYRSLAVSQDDFFQYLARYRSERTLPTEISGRLADSLLMFLGFELSDWTFRILLQTILAMGSAANLLAQYRHVAIQINPAVNPEQDLDAARRYLRQLASVQNLALKVRIYWGTTEQFLSELASRW